MRKLLFTVDKLSHISFNCLDRSGYHRGLLLSAITGHQGRRLDDLSGKGVIAMFAHLVISMFRYLDSHRSRQLLELFPVREHFLLLHQIKLTLACASPPPPPPKKKKKERLTSTSMLYYDTCDNLKCEIWND